MTDKVDRLIARLVIFLGAPKGESTLFYRDMAIGIPFLLASFGAIVLASEHRFTPRFWAFTGIVTMCLIFAIKRIVLIAGLFGFAAVRFVFVFLVSHRLDMLGAAVVCAALSLILVVRS